MRECLAQGRRSRLSEKVQKATVPICRALAKAKGARLSERPSRLSKELGEEYACSIVSLSLDVGYMFGFDYTFKT